MMTYNANTNNNGANTINHDHVTRLNTFKTMNVIAKISKKPI